MSPDNDRLKPKVLNGSGTRALGAAEQKVIDRMSTEDLRKSAVAHGEAIKGSIDIRSILTHAARVIILSKAALRKERTARIEGDESK